VLIKSSLQQAPAGNFACKKKRKKNGKEKKKESKRKNKILVV
jgi:hypothetical protein